MILRSAPARYLLLLLGSLAVTATLVLDQQFPRGSGGNAYQREQASNGPFQFFAAFRNNELDYPSFYANLPQDEVVAHCRPAAQQARMHHRLASRTRLA